SDSCSCCSYSTTKMSVLSVICGDPGAASQTDSYPTRRSSDLISLTAASSLGCNPTSGDIAAAFGSASVSDNCSTGLVATGTVGSVGGSRGRYSATKSCRVTDYCGNTGTASQTVTYTRDLTAPV